MKIKLKNLNVLLEMVEEMKRHLDINKEYVSFFSLFEYYYLRQFGWNFVDKNTIQKMTDAAFNMYEGIFEKELEDVEISFHDNDMKNLNVVFKGNSCLLKEINVKHIIKKRIRKIKLNYINEIGMYR